MNPTINLVKSIHRIAVAKRLNYIPLYPIEKNDWSLSTKVHIYQIKYSPLRLFQSLCIIPSTNRRAHENTIFPIQENTHLMGIPIFRHTRPDISAYYLHFMFQIYSNIISSHLQCEIPILVIYYLFFMIQNHHFSPQLPGSSCIGAARDHDPLCRWSRCRWR